MRIKKEPQYRVHSSRRTGEWSSSIAKAKKNGVYKGRKPSIDRDAIKKLINDGVSPSEIADRLSIARSSVYRIGAE